MSNSYVKMEQRMCPVCGKRHECGGLLLHTQLKDIPDDKTVTGYDLCPEHQTLFDDGYIAFVEVSNAHKRETLKMEDANRTGQVVHVRRTAASWMFSGIPEDLPMVFVEPEVVNFLKSKLPTEE